ncbi:MAG: flagellar motor protein MotB [Candidatus Hydrogenedentes bacterium]|nr:flagellar motor protein MotB [Candidatus Hydrogenedentota bacterium]
MARKKCKCPPPGAPAWMATFADMMSLLLTFFVLLLSFSTISEDKFKEALMSLEGGFRPFPRSSHFVAPLPKPPRRQNEEAQQAARKLRRQLQVRGLERKVRVDFDALGGIKINLPASLLFEPGEAALRPAAIPVIRDIAAVLAELPESFFEVQGHTDTTPLASTARFRDNYDLSYERAHSVTEQMVISGGLPVNQFEIHAMGATQPMATNATEEGRAANRRVEIYVRGLLDKARLNTLLQGLDTEGQRTDLPLSPAELDELR